MDLTTRQQAIEYITHYMNKHNDVSPQSMEYWIVSKCELSEREDYWLGYGNGQGYVKYDIFDYCYVGGSGFVIHRNTGEITMLVAETPKDYVQRQYDIADANGKVYALINQLDDNKENILFLKKTFNISVIQAKFLLKEMPIWFVGEKMIMQDIQNLLAEQNLHLSLQLVDSISTPVFTINGISYDWVQEKITTFDGFLELQTMVQKMLTQW